jgi:DNA-binding Xre family transcriptional regulator
MSEEQRRLRMVLREAVGATRRPVREIERTIGIGNGNLARLLDGRLSVRIHHLVGLAAMLEVPPGDFLELSYTEASATAKYRLRDWIERAPATPDNGAGALAEVVRQVVREELARLHPAAAPE